MHYVEIPDAQAPDASVHIPQKRLAWKASKPLRNSSVRNRPQPVSSPAVNILHQLFDLVLTESGKFMAVEIQDRGRQPVVQNRRPAKRFPNSPARQLPTHKINQVGQIVAIQIPLVVVRPIAAYGTRRALNFGQEQQSKGRIDNRILFPPVTFRVLGLDQIGRAGRYQSCFPKYFTPAITPTRSTPYR